MTWRRIRNSILSTMALVALALAAQPLSAADMTGKWTFSWNTDNGVIRSSMDITQQGEELTAKFETSDLAGSATEDNFRLEGSYYAAEAGFTGLLKISGKQEGDKLAGSGSFEEFGLTFTAVREK